MEIRAANHKKDFDFFMSTFEDLFVSNIENWKPSKKNKKKFEKNFYFSKGKKLTKLFIGEIDNIQVGYIEVFIIKNPYTKSNEAKISKVYILPRYRNKGHSRKLIEKAKEFAKEHNCETIYLNSFPNNFELYKKLSFEPISFWMKSKV